VLFHFKAGGAQANNVLLKGNVLDVAIIQTSTGPTYLIISIDNIHKSGSTTEVRDDKVSSHSIGLRKTLSNSWKRCRDYNIFPDRQTANG